MRPPSTRLWLLRPRPDVLSRPSHPWTPPYDKTFGVVVRAVDCEQARRFAHDVSGDEGLGVYRAFKLVEDEVAGNVWLRPEFTDCKRLTDQGEPGVVIVDRWKG
jgi:hypothetical protein